jgi:hypothetical protein
MWRFAVLTAAASAVISCSPDAEVTGSTNKCFTDLKLSINAWQYVSNAIEGLRPLARRHVH